MPEVILSFLNMKRLTGIIITALFISCDCYRVVTGITIDKETKAPIKDVLVYNKKDKEYTNVYTDSLGDFKLADINGGILRCPPMNIVIEAEGYVIKEDTIPAGSNKIIELEKIKTN